MIRNVQLMRYNSCHPGSPAIVAVFEPGQLPQETICPSVAFAKGQIGNGRAQRIIYYNIKPFRLEIARFRIRKSSVTFLLVKFVFSFFLQLRR